MRSTFVLFAMLMVSGCSTIIEGRSQQIQINTNPEGAACKLVRKGETLTTVSPTPACAYIEKTKDDIKIICSKTGYETATYMNKSSSAGATFGNIVAGGLIGWGVDSATGSDNKYDSPVNITLSKK
ncbi:MAG: hypothetical protein WC521_02575 [Bdellovibrionales bacterium]